MSLLPAFNWKDEQRNNKLASMDESDRERVLEADKAARDLLKRVEKLTTPDRAGKAPLYSVSKEELDAIVAEADDLVRNLPPTASSVVTEDIWSTHYRVRRMASGELSRRYNERVEAAMHLDNLRFDFKKPLHEIARAMDGFTAAMGELTVEELLGPSLECTERSDEDISAMTDRELEDATYVAWNQLNDLSVSITAGEQVERMAEVLPEIAKAMLAQRERDLDAKRRAEDVRARLRAEQDRRRDEAKAAADRAKLSPTDRIAELEKMVARLGERA